MKIKMSHLNIGFWELRERQKNLEKYITSALEREAYSKDGSLKVMVPRDIRKAYFEMFKSAVEKDSIRTENYHGRFSSSGSDRSIIFNGRSARGIGNDFLLKYFPEAVELQISSYSFNGNDEEKNGIREIGLISTVLTEDENIFQTHLKVGDNFKYNNGFSANHDISTVIDRVQNSEVIPHIPSSVLSEIPGCDILLKEKEEMVEV